MTNTKNKSQSQKITRNVWIYAYIFQLLHNPWYHWLSIDSQFPKKNGPTLNCVSNFDLQIRSPKYWRTPIITPIFWGFSNIVWNFCNICLLIWMVYRFTKIHNLKFKPMIVNWYSYFTSLLVSKAFKKRKTWEVYKFKSLKVYRFTGLQVDK